MLRDIVAEIIWNGNEHLRLMPQIPVAGIGKSPSLGTVNVTAVADIDDDHEKFVLMNLINDSITSDAIGIKAFEFTFQSFSLKGIVFKIIKGLSESFRKFRFSLQKMVEN